MTAPPLLAAHQLSFSFKARGSIFGRSGSEVKAVDGIDLAVGAGEALGVVGESGAGKSTLIRLLLALSKPSRGRVLFDGQEISGLSAARLRPIRRRMQAVFQDPTASLNPRLSVATIVAEPLAAHRIGSPAEQKERVAELLELVGLDPSAARLRPQAFSAGQRQRIAIARALAPKPDLLLLDEPVSSLDASLRFDLLYLFQELRERLGLTLIVVSHDLQVIRFLSDRVAVLYRGRVVESGPCPEVFEAPFHPYTEQLVGAESRPVRTLPASEPISVECRFRHRCPHETSRCAIEPPLTAMKDERQVACWIVAT